MERTFDSSVGLQQLQKRLVEQRDDVEYYERRLLEAKRRRDLLILKAIYAKLTTRIIAPVAGVSFVRVSQIGKLAKGGKR